MSLDASALLDQLPLSSLDAEGATPLYHQIEADLQRLIGAGSLPAGTTLPPEMALCRAYGVGRHTVRMALSRLAADGLIERQAGRGTIVRAQPGRTQFLLDRSFTQQMAEMGRVARSQVLDCFPGAITAASPAIFADHVGAPCLRLVRLRFGDDEPIGLQYSTILTEHCPGLENHDFNQHGLYDVLARDYQLAIAEIRHAISATVADDFQAGQLRIHPGAPLLVVNTTTFLANNRFFEYTSSYYRADRYEYSTTHTYSV